ncbi:MAG: YkgJ family cysteine cluster protein [Desulfotalea sp.]
MSNSDNEFPEGLNPIDGEFKFKCHESLSCFTKCCQKVDIILYPFDLIRLKKSLKMDSEKFINDHVQLVKGVNPFFPSPMLKLLDNEKCPFLGDNGCTVYRDRPSACRTYPLERAVVRDSKNSNDSEFYFMTNHDYCLGHGENQSFSVKQWVRNQQISDYNLANELWTEIDSLFLTNPWKGEGVGGPKQQAAFMVCYNIDGFRRFSDERQLPKQFKLDKNFRKRIATDDAELQKFGFIWLKQILTGSNF